MTSVNRLGPSERYVKWMSVTKYAACLLVALGAGCYLSSDATNDGGGSTPDATPPDPSTTGMPCDVTTALASCAGTCHANPPSGGAPMPLVTYADLTAQSAQYPGQTYAERCVARMQAGTMPPGGGASSTDITALQNWIAAGYPQGTCGADSGGPITLVCTSGKTTSGGEGPTMDPGRACIACHGSTSRTGTFAGTIYPSLHEKDDCVGDSLSTIRIAVQDNAGHNVVMAPNSSGNFCSNAYRCTVISSSGTVTMPYTVTVTNGSSSVSMTTPQTSGDCNSCHTALGTNGAPGRIVAP